MEVFRYREDLMYWVQNVAHSQGFVIVTKRSRAITIGFISNIVLGSDRGGKYMKARGFWTLRVVRDEHNHEPSMYMEGHLFAMQLSDKESHLVQELTKLNVKPQDILSTLKEQNPNNVSSLRTIYNFRRSFRDLNKKVEPRCRMGNELEDLFFIHPTSLKMWQTFPYVVLMDDTYKTNKYNFHFLEIVGVTSTNKTFSIAFAFMCNEKTSNYRWALTCLKLTINESFSLVDMVLMKACEEVFPQTLHDMHQRGSLRPMWKKLVESPTPSAYLENYATLQTLLFEYPNVFGYLCSVWLDKYVERFVSLWTDKHISFGNSTTNRVDSQHSKLKKHLNSAKCDLDRFIYVIEKVVQAQLTAIKESLARCRIFRKPKFENKLFRELEFVVSFHAMDKVLEELHRLKGFSPTPKKCGCQLRTCFGLPYAHELAMYINKDLPIPLDSIDVFFWKKLDLELFVSVEYGDFNCDHGMQRFKEIYNNQPDQGKINFIRKSRGIMDPSKILINEPSIKKNNRGHPKVKRGQHQTQAPHRMQDYNIKLQEISLS
uniref:MULE transposase domain-containing protein n=1 Tax=Lactuca sativa TaxID=4236 RepID=A0A9R1WQ15_LACSA|nr:hypothetical protein LSAT_V11C100027130 [Lactuca sativa]